MKLAVLTVALLLCAVQAEMYYDYAGQAQRQPAAGTYMYFSCFYIHATLPMLILPLMASCIYTGQGDMYYDYVGQAQRQPAAGTCTLAASTCYFTHAHSTSHGIMHIHRTGRYVL